MHIITNRERQCSMDDIRRSCQSRLLDHADRLGFVSVSMEKSIGQIATVPGMTKGCIAAALRFAGAPGRI
jgi:hypothetical protein